MEIYGRYGTILKILKEYYADNINIKGKPGKIKWLKMLKRREESDTNLTVDIFVAEIAQRKDKM